MKTLNNLAIAAMICGVLASCENKVTYEVPAPEDESLRAGPFF